MQALLDYFFPAPAEPVTLQTIRGIRTARQTRGFNGRFIKRALPF